jgi:Kiwa KwaB-like protein
MKLDFDIEKVRVTEFGVGRDNGNGQTFLSIQVDTDVQNALREMVSATWQAMQNDTDTPPEYVPSEKHGGTEYLHLRLSDELAKPIRDLHEAANLPIDATALAAPARLFCYFGRMSDSKGRHLTAVRRATQFKGVVKSRLIRLVTDSLKLVPDKVFKLDSDFDLLVDAKTIHILRPSGFEFTGKLQEAILAAVSTNIKSIQEDLPFVNFANVEEFAGKHPRAARYLASIRSQKETKNIDKRALKKLCKDTGVEVKESNRTIIVDDGHVMAFLEVLDRRRYELELVKGCPERFKAASRQKIGT